MESFGHTVVSVEDSTVQSENSPILYLTGGSVKLDGKVKRLAVLAGSGGGQLVTVTTLDDDFENVVVQTNSPIKEEEVVVEYEEVEGGSNSSSCSMQDTMEREEVVEYTEVVQTDEEPAKKRGCGPPQTRPMCKICCKTFSKRKGYTKHMRKIHNVYTKVKGEPTTPKDLVCKYCNKSFAQRGSLNVHVLAIHNPQGLEHTYKCAECDYKTFVKSKFQEHMVRNHLTKKPERKKKEKPQQQSFPCEYCDKVFKNNSNLNAHSQRVHFPDREYKCDMCEYKTTDKYFFKKHLVRRHLSSQKPRGNFQCDKCDATFQKEVYMKVHKKRVHKMEVPNTCHRKKCPLCPFVSRQLYRNEILAHYKDTHNIEITSEKLVFDNVDSFNTWRKHIQETSRSQFKGDDLTEPRTKWFNCHRSGHYDLSKGAHRSNGLYTTIKINAFCPATIHTIRLDGSDHLEVEYWPVHVGHDPNEPIKKKTFLSNTDVEVEKVVEKPVEKQRRSKRKSSKRKLVEDYDDDEFIEIDMTPTVQRSSKLDYDKLVQSAVQTKRKLRKIEDGVEVITVENVDDELVETSPEDKILTVGYDELVKDTLDMELAESSVEDSGVLRGKEVEKTVKLFKCGYCSYDSVVREDCQRHVREHSNHECNECDFKTADYTKLRLHMREHSRQVYKCESCDVSFSHKPQLQHHVQVVHNEKKKINYYYCKECDYTTSNRRGLECHVEKLHESIDTFTDDRKYKCRLCYASYHGLRNLQRHEKHAHNLEPTGDCDWLKCSDCCKLFRHRHTMGVHERLVHGNTMLKVKKKCPLCEFVSSIMSRHELHDHLKEAHNITLESKVSLFNSATSFYEWKADLEAATGSTLKGRQGRKTRYYMCLKNTQTLADGVSKQRNVATFCPSEIHLRQFGNGRLLAEYWPVHVGHECPNNVNWTLSESWVNAFAAAQRDINLKYGSKTDTFVSNNEKLTGEQEFTGNSGEKEGVFDDVWVEKLRNNPQTCMLHVKSTNDEYPGLQAEDFFLIYMTHSQREKFSKLFAMNGTIFVDKVCNIGENLHVFTISVVEESKTVCPVTCLFTNRCEADEAILSIFFEKLKLIFGCLTAEVFMSDAWDTAYSVWCNIMLPAEAHVYSTLHVLRAWKSNMDKISNKEIREHVSSVLTSLLCEVDKPDFIELLDEIKKSLMFENEAFFKYFSDKFLTNMRYKLWANCFAGERDFSFECYEHVLKKFFLLGVASKSLKNVLQLAVETFSGETCDCGGVGDKLLSKMEDRHTSSLAQARSGVTESDDSTWLVRNSSSSNEEFFLVKKIISCRSCELVCDKCKSCVHEYVCSCWDSAVRGNMCVHVHLVARSLLRWVEGYQGYETEVELVEDLHSEQEEDEEEEEEEEEKMIELDLVVDESGGEEDYDEEEDEEEEEEEEKEEDEDSEEVVIHCGALEAVLESKSADESDVAVEVDDPNWVNDTESDNEEIVDENRLKRTRYNTRNKSIVSSRGENKDKSSKSKTKVNTKGKFSDVNGSEVEIEVMDLDESPKTPQDRSKKREVITGDEDEEMSNLLRCDIKVEIDEERSPISKSGKTKKHSDKVGSSVEESILFDKSAPQLQLKIVDIRSISRKDLFDTENKNKFVKDSNLNSTSVSKNEYDRIVEEEILDESQRKPRITVVPPFKLLTPLKPNVVDTRSEKSTTQGIVCSNDYDKIVEEEVISDKSQGKPRINVISPTKLLTPVKDVDTKIVENKQEKRNNDKKNDDEIVSDKPQKNPKNNIATRSKSQTPLKVVDSKSVKDKQGSVSKTKDEKLDKKVISDELQKYPSENVRSDQLQKTPIKNVRTRSKLKTDLEASDSKSIKSTRGRSKSNEKVEKVISDESQKKTGLNVSTRAKAQTPLKVGDSISSKTTQGSVSKTKDRKKNDRENKTKVDEEKETDGKQDNEVISDEVANEEQKIDEKQDNEVSNEESRTEESEEAPEFEDNVMKFVEFCQKKAKNKEQLEYLKKMMAKVMAEADGDS